MDTGYSRIASKRAPTGGQGGSSTGKTIKGERARYGPRQDQLQERRRLGMGNEKYELDTY